MVAGVNLLPQAKQDKQKDVRKRSLVLTLLVVINGGLIGLMVVLFLITQTQHLVISRVQSSINDKEQQISSTKNVQDILTLQHNLNALPSLYSGRVALTKFFALLEDVSPNSVFVTSLSTGQSGKLEVTGTAPNYASVSTLADAMKQKSFKSVNLTSATGQNGVVSFTITATAPLTTEGTQ